MGRALRIIHGRCDRFVQNFVEKMKERGHFVDLGIYGGMILRFDIMETGCMGVY